MSMEKTPAPQMGQSAAAAAADANKREEQAKAHASEQQARLDQHYDTQRERQADHHKEENRREEQANKEANEARDRQQQDDARKADDAKRDQQRRDDYAKSEDQKRDQQLKDNQQREQQQREQVQRDQQQREQQQRDQRQQQDRQADQQRTQQAQAAQAPAQPALTPQQVEAKKQADLKAEVSAQGYKPMDTKDLAFVNPEQQKAFEERQAKAMKAIEAETDPSKRADMMRDKMLDYHEHSAQMKMQAAHESEHGKAGKLAPRPDMKHPMADRLRAEAVSHQEQALALRQNQTAAKNQDRSATAGQAGDKSLTQPQGKASEDGRNHAHERTVARNAQHVEANKAAGKTQPPEQSVHRAQALSQQLEAKQSQRMAREQAQTQTAEKGKTKELTA